MQMETRKENGVVILTMSPEDLNDPRTTSGVLENFIKDEGDNKFIVDLSKVDAMYSLQIGTLVTMHVMCYENVSMMKLCGANRKVRNLLRMVGLEAMMEMHHGTDVAIESFTSSANNPAVRDKPTDPRVKS
jgi:anti-anti-sigma factor